MERARRDEQDVVGLDHPVFRGHRRAFDQRQQVALHALPRDIGAVHVGARCDLVDLVQEHDAVLLGGGERLALDVVVVEQPRRFLVGQLLHRVGDRGLDMLAPAAAHLLEHALDLARQLLHSRRRHDFHLLGKGGQLYLHFAVVERAFAQHLAEFLARGGVGGLHVGEIHVAHRRQQDVEQALLGRVGRVAAHLAGFGLPRLLDRDFHEVANDRVHVAPDVADLGELGRLDLDERRIGKPRQPARDLRLAHAGRPDHQDVLRRDLVAQRFRHLLPPPAIAQRDRDGALGGLLPDDVLVEFGDDFLGCHLRRHRMARAAAGRKTASS